MRIFMASLGFVLSVFLASMALAEEQWTRLPEPPPMPAPVKTGMAPVNGIQMYYAVYGEGDGVPILMIHGGLGYADIWANQVKDLARDHRVIVADSRGHGRSTRDKQAFGYDLMASDYLALLDYLKIDKVDLVGWSDGGIIGLDIAMKHPEKLRKLFAHAANSRVDGVRADVMESKTFLAYIERCGKIYQSVSPTPAEYDAFVQQISAMWASQPNWSDADLQRIATPTQIVLGDHDEAVDRKHTEYLAAQIPNAKLILLKDVSHFAMLQDPAGYTAAIRAFFDH
jgi:pimeloyl-ACP methyl ester carboxylesterase